MPVPRTGGKGCSIMPRKPKPTRGPGKHTGSLHIDKRAQRLLEDSSSDGNDDELLTTRQMAEWLQCSEQWLEIKRGQGGGPPFVVLANRMVRYLRGKGREWLKSRMHLSTSEYTKRRAAR